MATADQNALARAGFSSTELDAWSAARPELNSSFGPSAAPVSEFLTRGSALVERLPAPPQRTDAERQGARAVNDALNRAREDFLRLYATELYEALTDGYRKPLRVEELVRLAASRIPGLTPSAAQMDAERELKLADKEGIELSQGLLISSVLASPRAGGHLVQTMLQPTPEAIELAEQFSATGVADLGAARVTRDRRAGVLELSNPRHLNAEDEVTLRPTEAAVDLILLDPAIEIGVFRGAVVDDHRYAGRRVFGSGINLTHLYQGKIDFLFYLVRDLGYVSKLYRGVADRGETTEKLWVAAVETFAIGGACQLLHVIDHVIAARGARLYLPARKEGIIPGASNLRLPRFVGDRAARQAILSGREWTAGDPDAELLCDEVVGCEELDAALRVRIDALTSSGLINAAANRRALRVGQEPLELFREYMATYAREQAYCHLSPALVRNLEQHWNARQRSH
ncbi:MAG: enoyl-CoA hydratase/isomerase family protein [Solirubrobacteraceae bacterium]